MKKKIALLICAFLIAAFSASPVYAAPDTASTSVSRQPIKSSVGNPEISPYFSYLNSVFTDCYMDGNILRYYGDCTMMTDKKLSLTVTLQKSTNGTSWSKVTSTNKTFTGIGTHVINKTYSPSAGYYYRAEVIASPLNDTNAPLETAIIYSDKVQITRSGNELKGTRIQNSGERFVLK